jgi:hypothetical protein
MNTFDVYEQKSRSHKNLFMRTMYSLACVDVLMYQRWLLNTWSISSINIVRSQKIISMKPLNIYCSIDRILSLNITVMSIETKETLEIHIRQQVNIVTFELFGSNSSNNLSRIELNHHCSTTKFKRDFSIIDMISIHAVSHTNQTCYLLILRLELVHVSTNHHIKHVFS